MCIFSRIAEFYLMKWMHVMDALKENTAQEGGKEKQNNLGRVWSKGRVSYLRRRYGRSGALKEQLRDCQTSWEMTQQTSCKDDTMGKVQNPG